MISNYVEALEAGFHSLDSGPEMTPKDFELKDDTQQDQMNQYLLKNHGKYNKSQCHVMEQVVEMPKDEILLIQGPVSCFNFI